MEYIRREGLRRMDGYDDLCETRGNTVGKRLLALELLRMLLATVGLFESRAAYRGGDGSVVR
jgi:hypothetical protein